MLVPDGLFDPIQQISSSVEITGSSVRFAQFRQCPSWVAIPQSKKIPNFRNFACQRTQISLLICPVPSHRGALRNVINAGRDAVDAVVPLTNGAAAYGQVVSF